MRSPSGLADRPAKGFTRWTDGVGEHHIGATWWQARAVHFPRENISHWYDGSELVGVELWGCHECQWCMKKPPADWQPAPPGYRVEAELAWFTWRQAAIHRQGHVARLKRKRACLDPLPLKALAA